MRCFKCGAKATFEMVDAEGSVVQKVEIVCHGEDGKTPVTIWRPSDGKRAFQRAVFLEEVHDAPES